MPPHDTKNDDPAGGQEALENMVTTQVMNGLVNLDNHDGLLGATQAVMLGVASGQINDKRGAVLLRGVKTALDILEAKRKVHVGQNPMRLSEETVTPDGPFGFRRKAG